MVENITLEEAIVKMGQLGYEREQFELVFQTWLDRGDRPVIFTNHDLSSLATRILGFAMPYAPDEEIPLMGAPDGSWGPGWRYMADFVVTEAPEPNTAQGGTE